MVSTWPIQFCWCMSPLLDFLVNETMIITKRKKKQMKEKAASWHTPVTGPLSAGALLAPVH